MHRLAWAVVVAGLIVRGGVPGSLFAQEPSFVAPCADLPVNVRMNAELRRVVLGLLARSPTLQQQCATIAGARHVNVVVQYPNRTLPSTCNAKATISFSAAGLVHVVIEIPVTTRYAELLAHEFEHVVEAIEGIDLEARAKIRGSGVTKIGDRVFETARARRAGHRADFELGQRARMQ
jgi:hypothetical protein